jgi:hypothetical protein
LYRSVELTAFVEANIVEVNSPIGTGNRRGARNA